MAWMVVDWYPEYLEARRLEARRAAIQHSMDDLRRANRVLVAQIQALDTARGMELALRDRGYVRQGEVSLSVDGPRGRYVPAAEPRRRPRTIAEAVAQWVAQALDGLSGREPQADSVHRRPLAGTVLRADG